MTPDPWAVGLTVIGGIAASIIIHQVLLRTLDPIRNPGVQPLTEEAADSLECPDVIPEWVIEEALTDI